MNTTNDSKATDYRGRDDTNFYEATFAEQPTDADLANEQEALGYPPLQYGGPFASSPATRREDGWRITWKSWSEPRTHLKAGEIEVGIRAPMHPDPLAGIPAVEATRVLQFALDAADEARVDFVREGEGRATGADTIAAGNKAYRAAIAAGVAAYRAREGERVALQRGLATYRGEGLEATRASQAARIPVDGALKALRDAIETAAQSAPAGWTSAIVSAADRLAEAIAQAQAAERAALPLMVLTTEPNIEARAKAAADEYGRTSFDATDPRAAWKAVVRAVDASAKPLLTPEQGRKIHDEPYGPGGKYAPETPNVLHTIAAAIRTAASKATVHDSARHVLTTIADTIENAAATGDFALLADIGSET